MRPPGSSTELGACRRLAVRRVAEGWKQKDVAAFLGVSTRAVGGWVAAHRKASEEGLKSIPHPGPAPKLTRRWEQSVLFWLARSTLAFGCKTDLRTTRRLAEVIAKRYGVHFNANYLADWPRIQKKVRDDGAHVVLIDESGFFLNPLVRRTWAPKGHTPVLTGFGRHRQKVSTIAALSLAPGRWRVGLYWKTDPKGYIDASAVVEFLRGLLRYLKAKVIVV